MPVYAQQLILEKGSRSLGLTVGDTVHLTARARNLDASIPWTLQIWQIAPTRRLLANGASVTELQFDVTGDVAESRTYQAILNQPPMVAVPINSNEVEVAWAERTPKQLILEVNDRKVTVNYTFEDLSKPNGVKRESTIWKDVFGASRTKPLEKKASPTGADWTAAVNWTAPLPGKTPAQVHAYFDVPLPPHWTLWLSLGGWKDLRSICGPEPLRCDIVIPHPDKPSAAWSVTALLYRDNNYVDREDINIQWVFP